MLRWFSVVKVCKTKLFSFQNVCSAASVLLPFQQKNPKRQNWLILDFVTLNIHVYKSRIDLIPQPQINTAQQFCLYQL
jgi:hypothetical protein